MNDLTETPSKRPVVRGLAPLPDPRAPVAVRPAAPGDVAFIDALQKVHRNQVGFMPAGQLEGKIAAGDVLVAEDAASGERVGYVIGTDRYFKHDDVGIIYHLNVAPGKHRGFIGATLLKAMFDRAAYGCKLFCCWCAQDIEANQFWEAMGFVPLAYRAGSEKRSRVHIFWQKRIRAGDCETPWWFPAKTDAGAMREDRLVLPIPPGMHWSDEMPLLRPDAAAAPALPDAARRNRGTANRSEAPTPVPITRAKAKFGAPPSANAAGAVENVTPETKPARAKPPRQKKKADPALVAAARELRDRWLERVNAGEYVFEDAGKYDVSRALPARASGPLPGSPAGLLPAA